MYNVHMRNQQCKYNLACNHKCIAVEVKCPYPNNAILEEPYYMVPKRHVPQLLAEMAALKVDELWLICYTRKSVSLIIVCHNEMLWNKILNIADDLYGPEKPNAPTRLHPVISQVKMEISEFIKSCCVFAMEVPPLTGNQGTLHKSELGSPYCIAPELNMELLNTTNAQKKCSVLATEARLLFHEGHRCLQQQAKEAMVFINSDKDRLHTSKVPNSAPMAYALKGKSMSTADLHHLINTCRCELLKRNIPILCEVYDGQWKNVVTFNEAGEPLTLLQMFKKSWDAVSRMFKDTMIQEVMKLSQIMAGDLDIMTYTYHFDVGITTLANV